MAFLKLLESGRTPFWDAVFSAVTHLGEEFVFIVLGLFVYWCLSKRTGFYILAASFAGTIINQFLKLLFRVPRPWVLDPEFTIVESAREQALGYSFPSGHTQNAVSFFGAIAICHKNLLLRVLCVLLTLAVVFSRLYLGVHTPLDVAAAAVSAVFFLALFYAPSKRAMKSTGALLAVLAVLIVLSAALAGFTQQDALAAKVDADQLLTAQKNAGTLLGAALGFAVGALLDRRFLNFETRAVWWAQILKTAFGLALLLALRSGLKTLLSPLSPGLADGVRYFVLLLFSAFLWPATFPIFSRLGKQKT